ncbi:MAG: thiosulfohydrolase SoxB [Magnetococcales bacterium]|nr:thiosulfohydrolase SoxB [Magnetococcales bacterium]
MNMTRREVLEIGALAAAALAVSPAQLAKAASQATADDLYGFPATGRLTLLHFTDCHAQLMPIHFREPSTNLGIGNAFGHPPHLTGDAFLTHFGIQPGSVEAYAYSMVDYVDLARTFGPVGGFAHMATLTNRIRSERGAENVLLLDSGDTWQGSYTSMVSKGDDMIQVCNQLGVEAMAPHWEFTYGAEQVQENIEKLNFPFLAHNVKDTEWEEPVFKPYHIFEKAGTAIGVIGQAFPYTPIANPRRMFPNWSMGIQEMNVQKQVEAARAEGAQVVVLLSHNGMDVDMKLASRVTGIDVILGGHTHDAVPTPQLVENAGGKTLVCNSGSNSKFLSRMDLDVADGRIKAWNYRLHPILPKYLPADEEMATLINTIRAPHMQELSRVVGTTESLLYRRGNFNGTFDDLICTALMKQQDAEIALSPGFRWGTTLLPGEPITMETIYTQTAITYPNCYRREMSGEMIKTILEDVADNLFNPDPYRQQGGDMVRVGGMRYAIQPKGAMGSRISELEVNGKPLDLKRNYVVSGWASMGEVDGPPVWDLVRKQVEEEKTVRISGPSAVKKVVS